MRGFAAVALENPKCLQNLGGAMRAAQCYRASLIVIGGPRMERLANLATYTMKAYRTVPALRILNVLDAIPFDCVPVAVELGGKDLTTYHHPERAFYIFGPEDGSLSKEIQQKCRDHVSILTVGCMNLAATVNVVLYDRLAKRGG